MSALPALGATTEDARKAAGYAELAGQRTMTCLAYQEVVRQLEAALRGESLAGDSGGTARRLLDLGEAQRGAGDPAHRETLLAAGRVALADGDIDVAARADLTNQRGWFSRSGRSTATASPPSKLPSEPSEQKRPDSGPGSWRRAKLAAHNAPVRRFFVDAFPLTPSGKVQKFALVESIASAAIVPDPWTPGV